MLTSLLRRLSARQCMCQWGDWEDSQALQAAGSSAAPSASQPSATQPCGGSQPADPPCAPPARLIAQIHDELLFECDAARCDPLDIGRRIKSQMEVRIRQSSAMRLSSGRR